MKKYKTTLTFSDLCTLRSRIEYIIDDPLEYDGELHRMICFAALAEMLILLKKKELEVKKKYKITLSPVQAFSLCFLYEEKCAGDGFANQFSNRMLQINNEVLQHYCL